MAVAILPFQVLLATKWNLITCLTGVSHEKLQVFHRWMGWIMCTSLHSSGAAATAVWAGRNREVVWLT